MHRYTVIIFSFLTFVSIYSMDISLVQLVPNKIQLTPLEQPPHVKTDRAVRLNSRLLKSIVLQKNFQAIEGFLEIGTLAFDPTWSGYILARMGKNGKETILDGVCQLGNVDIVTRVVKASAKDCFLDAIDSMAQYYKIDLLKMFIKKNDQRSRQERFSIWRIVLDKKSLWKQTPAYNVELECKMLKKVFGLLFSDEVNAQNEEGETLLHIAVKQSHELAVKFLLEHKADPNEQDSKKLSPLGYVLPGLSIAHLLWKYGARY